MIGPVQSRRGRFFLLLAPVLLGSIVIPTARSDAEEGKKVSSNTVVQGLKTIQTASEEILKQTGTDKAAAEKTVGVIAPVWSMIEGTIRANSQESYSALEKALEDLSAAAEAGDTRKAGGAAGAFSSAVNFYVAKFPADVASTAAAKAAVADKPATAYTPAPVDRAAASAGERTTASGGERTAAAAPAGAAPADTPPVAPSGTLARTGPAEALTALAGLAFALGGLAVIGGAGRRP